MKDARLWTLAIALCAAGCAIAPPPQPMPKPDTDSVELRRALENASADLRRIEQPPPAVDLPKVDLDAALSIPVPDNFAVRSALAYFTGDLKSDIQQSLTKSAQYKKQIERVLDANKLPKALAYLPVIESAYSETMISRAGARGLWQIMPETAREYGLRVDKWIDERADPDLSTRAAVAYLKDLYQDFHDWPLTLAAYNAGAGRIHRALDETHTSSFWELLDLAAVPRETRGYVPTFFATLMIATDPSAYGFRLTDPVQRDVRRIDVQGPLSLKEVAKKAHVSEALLREMNPVLRKGVVPRGTRVELRVPPAFEERIARVTRKNRPADRILTGGM